MEWNREKCLALIDEYEKHSVLWNPKHGSYYNKVKKHDAWEIIAELMGCSLEEAKKKMESILSSFRREKAKGKKSVGTGKGRHEIYVSKWFAFPRMAFLLDRDEPRNTIDSVEEVDIPNNEGEELESAAHEQEATTNSQDIEGDEIATQTPLISTASTSATPQSRNKRKKLSETSENSKVKEALGILKSVAKNNAVKADECGVYGQHVSNKLRSYAKRTRDIVQHNINNILFNADMRQYDIVETRHCSTSSPSFGVSSLRSSPGFPPGQHSLFHQTPVPTPSPHSYESSANHTPVPTPSPHPHIIVPSPHSYYQSAANHTPMPIPSPQSQTHSSQSTASLGHNNHTSSLTASSQSTIHNTSEDQAESRDSYQWECL